MRWHGLEQDELNLDGSSKGPCLRPQLEDEIVATTLK